MRILNIFFKNINSLEGEGRVYFDQGPIADSGVFAITGPNGSGKTSILDVITLGLYGETFRIDKPAAHVMTKQTSECFAQVEFALGGEKFRSSWQVKRTDNLPNTDILPPEMTLLRLDDQDEMLAETPSQVRSRIAELTGMDFHKFSKCMVLPQGDFAAFLNALDSERMDILEKISGTDIYTDYRQQTENQFAQAQTRLTQVQQDLSSIPLLSDEALQATSLDLQDFKEQVAEFKQQQFQLQQDMAVLQEISQLSQQQQALFSRRTKLQTQIEAYQQDLQRIASGQSAPQFRADLALLDNKQAEVQQRQATLTQYREELALLQRQLGTDAGAAPVSDKTFAEQKQAIDTLKLTVSEVKLELPRQTEIAKAIEQQIADNRAALPEIEDWLQSHQSDAVLLTDFPDVARLRNLRSELTELSGRQKSNANWTKNTTAALKKNQSALESTQTGLADAKAQIQADQKTLATLSQGKSFDELKELLQEQQDRVNDLKELNALAEVTARLTHKGWFSWLSRNKTEDFADESELQEKLDALREEISREENIAKVLELGIRNEALIKKMTSDRSKLTEGQPCFLCGSLTHPYVVKPPLFANAKKALVDQRGKIQALKSRIDNVSVQLVAAKKRSSQLSAKQKRLQQMHSQWTILANRLNIMHTGMEIGNLARHKQLLTQEGEELTKLSNLVKEHAQLQRNIAKLTNQIDSKQPILEKLTLAIEELQAAWNNRPPEFTEVEQQFAAATAEEKTLISTLETQLKALNEKLPNKGKENMLFDRLNNRRQDYQIYQLRQKGLLDEINALQDKLQACQSTIAAYQQQLSSSVEALSQQEQVGLHLAVIEKQKLIAEEELRLRTVQIELETIQRSLNEKLTATQFVNTDALRMTLTLIDQEVDIQQKHDADNRQLEQLDSELRTVMENLAAKTAASADTASEDAIQQTLKQLTQQIDIAEQEVDSLENKLAKQEQYRDRYQALQEQLVGQQQLFDQADAELKLINDDHGGFRRRIQQLMIDKLLSQTNQILEKLSGRYYLRGSASDYGLALEVEDTKQKNLRRLPQTLSGGESFVMSLALALALAEMASNGRAIDSLFLDEAFGTLDAEALYLAMSTLEGLKTQGKTVGIISHVEAVQKRIKTKIELVKKANGLSELRMVA